MFSRCKWKHRESGKLQINHIHSISEQPGRAFREIRFWMIFVDKLCFLLIVHFKKMTTKEWFNLFVVQILEKNYYTINVVTKHLILKRLHNVFFLIPQQRHQFPQIKLKLIVDEIGINEDGNICGVRRGSQSVVVRTPSFIDVIEGVWDPLLLEHSVPLLTEVERLASPKVAVLFSMSIQIDGTPEAEAVASDDNNHWRID